MTDHYAVIGNPISHSKSPLIHTEFSKQTGQDLDYIAKEIPLNDLAAGLKQLQADGFKGINITVPFKEQAFRLADRLSARAQAAGAVNTLIMEDDGTIVGDNTDGQGLVGDILANQVEIKNQRVLLIGAGGAARGCILPILAQHPSCLTITNRSFDKAQLLADNFGQSGNINAAKLASLTNDYDIVINSTSASLSNQLPKIDATVIAAAHCCYDMAYGSEETCFLTWDIDTWILKVKDHITELILKTMVLLNLIAMDM